MYELKFSNYLYEDVKSSVNYIKYVLQNPMESYRDLFDLLGIDYGA
jgi:hypothetical protein